MTVDQLIEESYTLSISENRPKHYLIVQDPTVDFNEICRLFPDTAVIYPNVICSL